MPRGFKRDEPLTMRLYENGLFLDERSFVGYDSNRVPHLLLFGDDMKAQRERVYQRDAGWCKINKRGCVSQRGSSLSREEFELDHKKGGLTGRCDCEHNLHVSCRKCHRNKHLQVQWGPNREQAIKDFEKVHGE